MQKAVGKLKKIVGKKQKAVGKLKKIVGKNAKGSWQIDGR